MSTDPEAWSLHISLRSKYGEHYEIACGIGSDIMREIARIDPPLSIAGISFSTFDDVVTVLRRKEMRERLFADECERMGHLLAQRMTDKEGWYGMDRAEALKDFGKLGVVK